MALRNSERRERERGECASPSTTVFSRACTAAAVGAVDAQVCARDGLPRGQGHVFLTFEPSGVVSKVEVAEGAFVGTEEAACLQAEYGKVRMPAFPGGPVRVGKAVRLR